MPFPPPGDPPDPGIKPMSPVSPALQAGFPGGSAGKESACNAGDLGLIPELGRSPGEGNGYPLQYSCLENPMDRVALQATVCEVTKSLTTERLSLLLSFIINGCQIFSKAFSPSVEMIK